MTLFSSESGILDLEPVGLSTLSRNTMRFSPSIIESIDSRVDVPIEKDEKVESAVALYAGSYDGALTHKGMMFFDSDSNFEKYRVPERMTLTPSQIDLVLQHLLKGPHMNTCDLSIYASLLIQRSYDAGYNGFVLHTQDVPLDCLGGWLKGSEEKKVSMIIYGDTGYFTGHHSRWCSVRHEGNAQHYYFEDAKHDEISISGMITAYPLTGAEDITLRTTNKRTFDHIKNEMYTFMNSVNRHILLLNASGKTLEECDDSMPKNKWWS